MFARHKARIAGVGSAEGHTGQFQVHRLPGRCSRTYVSSIGAGDDESAEIYILRVNGGSVSCKSSQRKTVVRTDRGKLCVGVPMTCILKVSW